MTNYLKFENNSTSDLSVLHSSSSLYRTTANDHVSWIKRNIKKRICYNFVADSKFSDGLICKCGFRKQQNHASSSSSNTWDLDSNTHSNEHTDAFGEIEFVGQLSGNIAKYVRVDVRTDMNVMMTLLMEKWNLNRPNLILTVTGGAKSFELRPKLKQLFRTGLMAAAQSTGAWIITGGMDAGVMSHVGEAVRDYTSTESAPTVCLGIAPWGVVANRYEYLVHPDGKWPAKYFKQDESTLITGLSNIDSNHTHFIFVDNGTSEKYATEIGFRTNLEASISKMKSKDSSEYESIPTCCVVLEGGPGTLETARSSLEIGTPVVVIKSSGRAANILSFAYLNSDEKEIDELDSEGNNKRRCISIINPSLRAEIMSAICKEFGEANSIKYLDWVERCLGFRDLITVFDFESHSQHNHDLNIAILQSLLKASKSQQINQLKLALAWNRVDVARKDIFKPDRRWNRKELEDVFMQALTMNRVEFVQILMENGVTLREFLSVKRLVTLYNVIEPSDNAKLFVKEMFIEKKKKNATYFSLVQVGKVLVKLMTDFYQPMYLYDPRYVSLDADVVMGVSQAAEASETSDAMKLLQLSIGDALKPLQIKNNDEKLVNLPHFDDPARELYIWSLLYGFHQMSLLFWNEHSEPINAALTGSCLLKQISKEIEQLELKSKYEQRSIDYERRATDVLHQCYQHDSKQSELLLIRKSTFGNSTCLTIAEEHKHQTFVSHSASQNFLNNIWMGSLANDNSRFRITLGVISTLFPPLWLIIISYVMKYRGNDVSSLDVNKLSDNVKQNNVENLKRSQNSTESFTLFQKMAAFINSPVIKFSYNCLFYLVFLALFSYFMLCVFTEVVQIEEIVLMIYVGTFLAEEIRHLLSRCSTLAQVWRYSSNSWHLLDFTCIFLFVLAVILRSVNNAECFTAARIFYSIDLIAFYFRLMRMFSVNEQLGPKIVMIYRMVIDLIYFMIILLVFIISYGVALNSIMYPNAVPQYKLFSKMMERAYFPLYGQMYLEDLEGTSACSSDPSLYINGTQDRCPDPETAWFTPIIMGIYVLMTRVLMFTILISMFNNTFEEVQAITREVWRFQRLDLIREFAGKPSLPLPFTIFNHVYILIRLMCKNCYSYLNQSPFEVEFEPLQNKQLMQWERRNCDDYHSESTNLKKNFADEQLKRIKRDLTTLIYKFDNMVSDKLHGLLQINKMNEEKNIAEHLSTESQTNEDYICQISEQIDSIDSKIDKTIIFLENITLQSSTKKEKHIAQKVKKKERLQVKVNESKILSDRTQFHVNSRSSPYPYSQVRRKSLKDKQVPWSYAWPTYDPVNFTHPVVLQRPYYADPDILSQPMSTRMILEYNNFDNKYQVDRTSFLGHYKVVDGVPLNPVGRTGLAGRGRLGRFGPNHAVDSVVTRWKRDALGNKIIRDNLPLLEVVMILRQDSNRWATPGVFVTNSRNTNELWELLKMGFIQKALDYMSDKHTINRNENLVQQFFQKKNGVECYKGYVDDPRNTDNSWIETRAFNFHDEDGSFSHDIKLKAGITTTAVRWMTISAEETIYANHMCILEAVAKLHHASF